MTHPLALPNKSGFEDKNGNYVSAGDRVIYAITGKQAVLDEALQCGDAYVTWEDGKYGTVRWRFLYKCDSV